MKLDRKKVYGWTETVATDGTGKPCRTAWLDPDGSLVVPASGTANATLAADGTWLDADALTYVDEAGNELPTVPSTFDAPVALTPPDGAVAIATAPLGEVAWFADNSGGTTHPVGQKRPNSFGLYDALGNVAEWTSTQEENEDGTVWCILRGGSWRSTAEYCVPCAADTGLPSLRDDFIGLRLCAESASAAPATLSLPGGVELAMVPIPGKGHSMGRFLVTQAQWEAVMGENPAKFNGAENPVENVSWDDCREFLEKLNALPAAKASGLVFRLPTAEESEFACRAGTMADEVDEEAFLDHVWSAVYQLSNPDLAAAVGERIFRFPFNYRAGPAPKEACLLASGGVAWLFAGDPVAREFVGLEQAGELEEEPEEASGEEEELDFGMM